MKFSLMKADPGMVRHFNRRLKSTPVTCDVYQLVAWSFAHVQGEKPICRQQDQQHLLKALDLEETRSWPSFDHPYCIIMPKHGLPSTWSNATKVHLKRRKITGVGFIEKGWLLVAKQKLASGGDGMASAWERCMDPFTQSLYLDHHAWRLAQDVPPPTLTPKTILLTEDNRQHLDLLSQQYGVTFNDEDQSRLLAQQSQIGRPLTSAEALALATLPMAETKTTPIQSQHIRQDLLPLPPQYQWAQQSHSVSSQYHSGLYATQGSAALQVPRYMGHSQSSLMASCAGTIPMAHMMGLFLSDLYLAHLPKPWEDRSKRAPVGALLRETFTEVSNLSCTTGIPLLGGFLRSHPMTFNDPLEPMCYGASIGYTRAQDQKKPAKEGDLLILLGEPSLRTGCYNGDEGPLLRSLNGYRQRHCLSVMDRSDLDGSSYISHLHHVSGGGLSHAIPTLLQTLGLGGTFNLDGIQRHPKDMNILELWINETEFRYLLVVSQASWPYVLEQITREDCPHAVLGRLDKAEHLRITSDQDQLVDLPLSAFSGMTKEATCPATQVDEPKPMHWENTNIQSMAQRILQAPSVADKGFFLTRAERHAGGRVVRDALVGPWQTAVADCIILTQDFSGNHGIATAVGERAPVAELSPEHATKLAISEALTNLASAGPFDHSTLTLRLDWQGCPKTIQSLQKVADTYAKAIGIEKTPDHHSAPESTIACTFPVVTASASIDHIRLHHTPYMHTHAHSTLVALNLSDEKPHLGRSILAQVMRQNGGTPATPAQPEILGKFLSFMHEASPLILAYHDRSDGGFFVTLCEMSFASHTGLSLDMDALGASSLSALFQEGAGAILQVKTEALTELISLAQKHGLSEHTHCIGHPTSHTDIQMRYRHKAQIVAPFWSLQHIWRQTNLQLSTIDFDQVNAGGGLNTLKEEAGLHKTQSTFAINVRSIKKSTHTTSKPRVAILREQGTHGAFEMAHAFEQAGFECMDVHMSDLMTKRLDLAGFSGLAICSGASLNNQPKPASIWAQTILNHQDLRQTFQTYFEREDTFTLGVQNGCQLLMGIRELIPGTEMWPTLKQNHTQRHECRWVRVQIQKNNHVLLKDMAGSILPIPISHEYGRACYPHHQAAQEALKKGVICMQTLDLNDHSTDEYPANPDGSHLGATAFSCQHGRVLAMMPLPERANLGYQHAWDPKYYGEWGPWQRIFDNAKKWVDETKNLESKESAVLD